MVEQWFCKPPVAGSIPIASFFGGVPEWSKGSDCKSDGVAFEGSNPSHTTKDKSDDLSFFLPFFQLQ